VNDKFVPFRSNGTCPRLGPQPSACGNSSPLSFSDSRTGMVFPKRISAPRMIVTCSPANSSDTGSVL